MSPALVLYLAICTPVIAYAAVAAWSLHRDRRARREAEQRAHPAGGRDAAAVDLLLWEREVQR